MTSSIRTFCLALILLSVVARLINVDSTVIGWHSWRQFETAALARNFHDSEEGILYPRPDWGGGAYVESEFQLYPYTVSLIYGLFGVNETYARLLSILLWMLGVFGLYRLGRRFYGEDVGLFASTTYAVIPLSLFYGRAVMPEATLLASIIWGLYFFDRWMERQGFVDWLAACTLISLAVLLKIPTLYVGLPLLYIAWTRSRSVVHIFKRPSLWILAAVVLFSAWLWYSHAHSLFLQTGNTFGIWMGSTDKWGSYSSLLTLKFYNDIFFKSIAERHLTWPAMLLFVYGMTLKRAGKREWLAEWWLLAVLIYILVVNKGNQVHEYYQLPFIPPAAIVVGRVWQRLLLLARSDMRRARRVSRAVMITAVASVLLLSGLRYATLLNGESDTRLIDFAEGANELIPDDAMVLDVADGNPVTLYLLHRKGWIANCGTIDALPEFPSYIVLHTSEPHQYDCPRFEAALVGADVLLTVGDHVLLKTAAGANAAVAGD